jgi:hypothetical protein
MDLIRVRTAFVLAVASITSLSSASSLAGGQAPPRYRIAFATYLGGSEWEEAREVIALPDGSALVGAQTSSSDIPTTIGALQRKYAGEDPAVGNGNLFAGDTWIGRLGADGSRLLAATYFGGSKQERNVYGLELDREGNVVVATATRSPDAPTTAGAFQPKYGGGPADMLVAKLSADLSKVLWCTYVGGSGDESPRGGIAVDPAGDIVVVGASTSADFPTTAGVVGPKVRGPRDSAVLKLRADGSGLVFSTLLGGSGEDDAIMGVRIGPRGEIHVAGHTKSTDFPVAGHPPQPKLGGGSDAYLATLSADGTRILRATYLGGTDNEFAEHRPWLDRKGDFILAGVTRSPDFPVSRSAFQKSLKGVGDGFVTKLSRRGDRFAFSTLLGGSGIESWFGPLVDAGGNIVVFGSTSSPDLPVTPDALQPRLRGPEDGALAILSADGSEVLFATYLGGSGADMIRGAALGSSGEIWLVGRTASEDFPVTEGAAQTSKGGKVDAFVVRLERIPESPRP